MRYFLAVFWKRGGSNPDSDLIDIFEWTDRDVWSDGETNDPAQWDDWLCAVKAVQSGERARPR